MPDVFHFVNHIDLFSSQIHSWSFQLNTWRCDGKVENISWLERCTKLLVTKVYHKRIEIRKYYMGILLGYEHLRQCQLNTHTRSTMQMEKINVDGKVNKVIINKTYHNIIKKKEIIYDNCAINTWEIILTNTCESVIQSGPLWTKMEKVYKTIVN